MIADQPTIEGQLHYIVNESMSVTLLLVITSNPLSMVTWYDKGKQLSTHDEIDSEMFTQKITSSYSIAAAECKDTKNLTVKTSNGIGRIMNTSMELIVNCK